MSGLPSRLACIYTEGGQDAPVLAEYPSTCFQGSSELHMWQGTLKPDISDVSDMQPLWDECVLVYSQAQASLWVLDVGTRKVLTCLQLRSSFTASACYLVSECSDLKLLAGTPLVRCGGCTDIGGRAIIIALLSGLVVRLIEFTDRTASFRPLSETRIVCTQDESIGSLLSLTAQHIALFTTQRGTVIDGTIDSVSSTVQVHYLGEYESCPAKIQIPGQIETMWLDEHRGSDTLTVQFTVSGVRHVGIYRTEPLSNIWAEVESYCTDLEFVAKIGTGAYHYRNRDKDADLVHYTKPMLPCTVLTSLSGKPVLVYLKGILAAVDPTMLHIFVGNMLACYKTIKLNTTKEFKPKKCLLTQKLRLLVHAETEDGNQLFMSGRTRARKDSCIVGTAKHLTIPLSISSGMWISIGNRFLCIKEASAYCVSIVQDKCTVGVISEGGDNEVSFNIGSETHSLPFSTHDGNTVTDDAATHQEALKAIYRHLHKLYNPKLALDALQATSMNTNGKAETPLTLRMDLQGVKTPSVCSDLVTPIKAIPHDYHLYNQKCTPSKDACSSTIRGEESQTASQLSQERQTCNVANRTCHTCTTCHLVRLLTLLCALLYASISILRLHNAVHSIQA